MKSNVVLAGLLLTLLSVLFLVGCPSKELTSAKVYIQQDNWDKAMEQLQQAVALYPNDAEAYYLLGEGHATRGEWEKMNDAFIKSTKIIATFEPQIKSSREKYWVTNFNSGVNRINSEDIAGAIRQFAACTKIDPTRIDAYRNLAVSYMNADSLNSAKKVYAEVLVYLARAEANSSLEQVALGLLDSDQSRLADLSSYKFEADKQKMIEIIHAAANIFFQLKEYDSVIALESEVLKIEPAQGDAVANIALAYDYMGEKEKAIEEYKMALEKNPGDKDLLFNLARLNYLSGNYDQAIDLFKQSIAKSPDDYEANLNVGNAYLSMGDNLRKTLVEKDTQNQTITQDERDRLISFYKDAIPYLEKALSIKSEDPNVWYNLGVAYVNNGNSDKGKECFDKADEIRQ